MSTHADIEPEQAKAELLAALAAGEYADVETLATGMHPADVAQTIDQIDEERTKLRLFAILSAQQASEVIRDVNESTVELLRDHLSDARLSSILEKLDTDDAADLIASLSAERQQNVLDRASPATRREVEELLVYEEDTAGGIMKTEVAAVDGSATVLEVREYIRSQGDLFHDIHNIFVTGEEGRLVGYVPLRRLVLASDATEVTKIMESDVVAVSADVDQEEVAHVFEKYDLLSLAVIDANERLVGRITIDDIVDVMQEEATEDILRLAGVAETAKIAGPAEAVRTRLPWLALNLVTASMSAVAISLFEHTIQALAAAAALMTIVASQGGNAGVQTMTLVVRGLALGTLEPRQFLRILGRECLTALTNGAVLGTTAGLAVYIWRGDALLGAVLGGAMVLNLLIAALFGSLIPLGLKVIGIDPAVASSTLVIAGTDVLGFLIFLGMLSSAVG
jgi:magnesium transporter